MDPVSNYKLACQQAEAAITQDYYNGQPPFKGTPACIPMVPVDSDGDPLVAAADIPFKYAELIYPDGRQVLIIETPFEVEGPGTKYRVRPVME